MSATPASVRTPVREHLPSVLVAGLSAAFGVGLLQVTGYMAAQLSADEVTGSSNTVALMLSIVALVFIVIATYVAAIITANTIPGTEVPLEKGFTLAFAISAAGALVALLPTFVLGRRRAPQPLPEAA